MSQDDNQIYLATLIFVWFREWNDLVKQNRIDPPFMKCNGKFTRGEVLYKSNVYDRCDWYALCRRKNESIRPVPVLCFLMSSNMVPRATIPKLMAPNASGSSWRVSSATFHAAHALLSISAFTRLSISSSSSSSSSSLSHSSGWCSDDSATESRMNSRRMAFASCCVYFLMRREFLRVMGAYSLADSWHSRPLAAYDGLPISP